MKDDEFEGDEQTQKAMKRNVTAPFGRVVEQTEDRHSKSAFVASTRSQVSWLKPLSVTQEAAGSSPVAPAISIGTRDTSFQGCFLPVLHGFQNQEVLRCAGIGA